MPGRCGIVNASSTARLGNDRKIERSGLVTIDDRAQENMDYVRTLLKTNQPEFAAMLDQIEREFSCPGCCGAFPVMALSASSRT
jgi:hypothetical protein